MRIVPVLRLFALPLFCFKQYFEFLCANQALHRQYRHFSLVELHCLRHALDLAVVEEAAHMRKDVNVAGVGFLA